MYCWSFTPDENHADMLKHALIVVVTVSVAGCQTVPDLKGTQGSGTIAGATTGSYIGQRMSGNSVAGGAAGAVIGFNLIRMFANKRDYAIKAFQRAAEHNSRGVTTNWYNPHNWSNGSYTPISTIQRPDGVYCRRIAETVRMNHQLYSNVVQTCRTGPLDRRWVVVRSDMASHPAPAPDSKKKSYLRRALNIDLSGHVKKDCVFLRCNAANTCSVDRDTGAEMLRLYKEALIEFEGNLSDSRQYLNKKMENSETWVPFGSSTKFENAGKCEKRIVQVVADVL
jgi:surface antigen